MGWLHVRPASDENAANERPLLSLALNHATATWRPRALIAGPFTGHESTSQLSSCTVFGSVHLPLSSRVTAMSRISFSLRSRNAVTTPSSVTAAAVEQHSHTRALTIVSPVGFHDASKLAAYSPIDPPSGSVVLF